MKYGVHLMCVEDGLDSSTSMGKMMITILGAVAELERENIIAQSLLGREEKAKSGGWNGGFAPYGYRLVKGDDKSKGKLETVPEEKTVVQLVFDMFLNRNMGYTAISGYLNRNGYTRPPAKDAIRPVMESGVPTTSRECLAIRFIRGAWHGESDGQRKFPAKITNIDL